MMHAKKIILNILKKMPIFNAGDLSQINIEKLGGWSNYNYKLIVGDAAYVLRIPGQGVTSLLNNRQHEQYNARLMSEANINAKVLYFDEKGIQLTAFLNGRVLTADDYRDPVMLKKMLTTLKTIHDQKASFINTIMPFDGIRRLYELVKQHAYNDCSLLIQLFPRIETIWHRILWADIPLKPCHNDPYIANFIETADGLKMIDWEYAGNSDPYWELTMFFLEMRCADDAMLSMVQCYKPNVSLVVIDRMVLYRPLICYLIALWSMVDRCHGCFAVDDEQSRLYLNRWAFHLIIGQQQLD